MTLCQVEPSDGVDGQRLSGPIISGSPVHAIWAGPWRTCTSKAMDGIRATRSVPMWPVDLPPKNAFGHNVMTAEAEKPEITQIEREGRVPQRQAVGLRYQSDSTISHGSMGAE